MGKPRKGNEELTEVISFRLPKTMAGALKAKIEAAGLTRSEFVRDYVLAERTQIVARPKTSLDKQRLLYLFNKTGNNINQLAHRANGDRLGGKTNEATYRAILTQLDAIAAYMKASLDHVD